MICFPEIVFLYLFLLGIFFCPFSLQMQSLEGLLLGLFFFVSLEFVSSLVNFTCPLAYDQEGVDLQVFAF